MVFPQPLFIAKAIPELGPLSLFQPMLELSADLPEVTRFEILRHSTVAQRTSLATNDKCCLQRCRMHRMSQMSIYMRIFQRELVQNGQEVYSCMCV